MVQNSCFRMCTNNSVRVISLAKPVKKGFLRRYKKRFIGSNWRKEWLVLHEDSSLEWYRDEEEDKIEGGITLKDAPEMMAAGPFANYVPGKPKLPKDTDPNCLIAFGNKSKDVINWFLAANMDDLNQWMTAISNTLPAPPKQPEPGPGNNQNGGIQNGGTLPPPYTPTATNLPPQNNINQQRPAAPQMGPGGYGNNGGGGYGGRGGYNGPGGGYDRGGGGYGGGAGQNTVIIDRGNNGLGNFASGMMMGAAMSGWGCGYGWGLGPSIGFGFGGWGLGYGFGGPRLGYNDTDINITNNYNTTNSTVNNGTDNNNSTAPAIDSSNDPVVNNDNTANNADVVATEADNGIDPGLDSGVDTNGFQPNDNYENYDNYDNYDTFDNNDYNDYNPGNDFTADSYDMGGFDMGGMDGMDFDL